MSLLDKLRELGISENLIKEIEKFRSQYPVDKEYESRIPVPTQFYYGSDVWEQAITAVLCGENLLLVGEKATGKNLFAENLAGVFNRPRWDVSFHVNMDGKQLLHETIICLKEEGYHDLYLWVLKENHHARKFYKNAGFIQSDDVLFNSFGKISNRFKYI